MAESNKGDCSEAKKPRIEQSVSTDLIFDEFYADEKLLTDLKITISAIQEWNDYSLCMLKIDNCNGMGPYTFSKAFCQTERYECEHRIIHNAKLVKKFTFASIFKYGEELLTCFIKPKNESCLPQRKGARIALAKLLHFLSKELEVTEKSFMKRIGGVPESEWTVILAHHLLSKLAVSEFYVIDSGCRGKQYRCPCQCGEKLTGMYGDTSIGSPSIWHGFVDVMMRVSVKFAEEEPDSPGGHDRSSVKTTDLKTSREQIIAQCIVFSFFQRKLYPGYAHHLIPSIGISKEKVVIYFYDCNNDVLLESSEMPYITSQGALVKSTIISLWLALNFKYFCSGITKGMKDSGFVSGFFELVQNKLDLYKDVTAPCETASSENEQPWTWGVRPENDEPAQKVEDINKLAPWRKCEN